MMHKLLANKLFHRSSATGCLIVDLPYDKDSTRGVNSSSEDSKSSLQYKLFASTWNVGGVPPSDDLNLEDWLDTKNNSYDIYVLGFQEIVPLSAKNVIVSEKSRASTKWNSLIRAALNKAIAIDPQRNEEHNNKVHPVKGVGSSKERSMSQAFQCIASKQMVGILITVWVRGDLQCFISHVSASRVGCGIIGCLGNKGAVSVRFRLHETSFCFACCHLASGGKVGDEMHRNSDAMEILTRTSFPCGPCFDLPQKILDHDRVILLGDLNYRISMPDAKTRSLVEQKKWSVLLENDQLNLEMTKGRVFESWNEGEILFSPTYKYYSNSEEYYKHDWGSKAERLRSPAWCDRILWHGEGLKQNRYDRFESKLSDHRPVRAVFTVEVQVL